jgi:cytochrome c oxidase assembly protein subunit 15
MKKVKSDNFVEVGGWPNARLHRCAILLACATVTLLAAGALVTSNEAGDSVPDWPWSLGRWLLSSNQFVANVRYEYSHRAIAGAVGIVTFSLTAWAWLSRSVRRPLKWLALAALVAVILQALIGGVRVLFPAYKAAIAIPHAFVAQSFFGLVVSLAVFTSRSWQAPPEVSADARRLRLRWLVTVTVVAVMIQLILGAGFRHGAFGIIPHIIGAVVVVIFMVWTAARLLRCHRSVAYLRRPALMACALLTVQLGLGLAAYLAREASREDPQPLEPMISLTVAHLVVGALALATILVLTLRSYQVLAPRNGPSPSVT